MWTVDGRTSKELEEFILKCPICGNRTFIEKKWNKNCREINFVTREINPIKVDKRRKYYHCAKCGFSLYGSDATRIRTEMKYLEE